ncbi:MAG: MBL fold metallo-hydrolase [Muribaculaceae bacterium]|nr:MBL fold metallo-hydrolase [Muribaculaceae bacterium]
MEIEFLGTGTSTGVPQLRCQCHVCRSSDPRDKRLRQSVIVRTDGKCILIDCGPDFRQQILRASDDRLDALLITHIHYDHVGGLDDLRPYAFNPFPIYGKHDVLDALRRHQLRYCFGEKRYPGSPKFTLHEVDNEPFDCCGIEVRPIPIVHNIPILGYRIGDAAYITDCKTIADRQVEDLHGTRVLIINALRREPHPTHLSLDQALGIIARVKPERAFLVHFSHDMGLHAEVNATLPTGVSIAHDGLIINV